MIYNAEIPISPVPYDSGLRDRNRGRTVGCHGCVANQSALT